MSSNTTIKSKYTCEFCEKEFPSRKSYWNHKNVKKTACISNSKFLEIVESLKTTESETIYLEQKFQMQEEQFQAQEDQIKKLENIIQQLVRRNENDDNKEIKLLECIDNLIEKIDSSTIESKEKIEKVDSKIESSTIELKEKIDSSTKDVYNNNLTINDEKSYIHLKISVSGDEKLRITEPFLNLHTVVKRTSS